MTTTRKVRPAAVSVEALLGQNGDLFKRALKESPQEVLEGEMTEAVGAGPGGPLHRCVNLPPSSDSTISTRRFS